METTYHIVVDRPLVEVLSSLTYAGAGDIPAGMAGAGGYRFEAIGDRTRITIIGDPSVEPIPLFLQPLMR